MWKEDLKQDEAEEAPECSVFAGTSAQSDKQISSAAAWKDANSQDWTLLT